MKEKEKIIIDFIKNNQQYKELCYRYNYNIEQYLDVVQFLYWNDILHRIKVDECDLSYFDIYKLEEYASFLIWMHKMVCEKGLTDRQEIKRMHLQEYNWYRQGNVLNQDKKFFLL